MEVFIINRTKIIYITFIVCFATALIHEIIQKISKRGKVIGTFDHAIKKDGEKYPSRICFKYEVNGQVYFFESDNAMKEKEFKGNGPKIKLVYDTKNPSKAALDDGWIGMLLQATLLAASIIGAKLIAF